MPLNLAVAIGFAAGLGVLYPSPLGPLAPALVGLVLFGWGLLLRRGPRPSVIRAWLAAVASISAFLVVLAAFIDEDSLLHMVWSSLSAALLCWMLAMSCRRGAFRHGERGRD